MALELVGGAFLSASLQVLFERMTSMEFFNFIKEKKLNDGLLKKLKIMLMSVNMVLNDAEEKQLRNPAVKEWLDELNEAIYAAEDLVDEINTEALRRRLECDRSGISSTSTQVLNYFISTRFNVKKVEQKVVEIIDRLEYIVKQKDVLGLKEGVEISRSYSRRLPTTLVEESSIYGRNVDKEAIIELLLLENDVGGNKMCVIPIVGMGGIGKTTLAQLVYNDERVMKNYDLKVWITVSNHEFDVFTLTKTIFEAISSKKCDVIDPYELQVKLKETIEGKKFFFVLDDVWNENYDHWDALKSPFQFGASGSKIIVTTRSENVASIMGTVPNHSLQLLSDEDCWQLFAKHAFSNMQSSAYSDLEVVGRKIVKKCKGLPLAVKSLAGLLHSEMNPKEWEKILENDIWELREKECNILPALWLSYQYLPSHLKRCFAYCAIFPKGYEFRKDRLILLWMAEDLLRPQKNKKLEEIGEECIDDLTSRSIFRRNQDGFTMHDLVNDLANFVSGDFCLRLDDNCSKVFIKNTRRLSYSRETTFDINKLEALTENKSLRTWFSLDHWFTNKYGLVVLEGMRDMRCLRVLSVGGYCATKLPDSIGNFKLLRYLDLSWSKIEEVPNTICALYNLQTLLLIFCTNLTRLPNSIGNLRHLRYLNLSYTQIEELPDTICNLHELRKLLLHCCYKLVRLPTNLARLVNLHCLNIDATNLKEMPMQMSSMKNLERLSNFVVGKNDVSNIKELLELQDLQGSLCISSLQNVVDVNDLSKTLLKDMKYLNELSLEWEGDADDSQKEREVLKRLQPHTNIRKLEIKNYGGTSFPNWVGNHSFSGMVEVKLSDCKNCYWLPPLGQLPCLNTLHITGFRMVEKIGDEFYNSNGSSSSMTKPFKWLRSLSFVGMWEWKEWSFKILDDKECGGLFSNLKDLHLGFCPELNGACIADHCLQSLTSLSITGSHQLVASLTRHRFPSLTFLRINYCPEIELFPAGQGLPSNIETIIIEGCQKLESFSKEGWPSNLKLLSILGCGKLFANHKQWDLRTLSSLRILDITSVHEELDSFPKEDQLPTNLIYLGLHSFPSLKSLNGKAFQQLTSLEEMSISDCQQLQCLPEEGLPNSLSYLNISKCGSSSLNQRCQREIGEDWHKIAHISKVYTADEKYYQ